MDIKKIIDTFRPLENREVNQKAAKSASVSGNAAQQGDRVSLSPGAQTLRAALTAAQAGSGVRTERVEQIKEQLANNTYQMNSRKTAEKMLEQEYGVWGRKA